MDQTLKEVKQLVELRRYSLINGSVSTLIRRIDNDSARATNLLRFNSDRATRDIFLDIAASAVAAVEVIDGHQSGK